MKVRGRMQAEDLNLVRGDRHADGPDLDDVVGERPGHLEVERDDAPRMELREPLKADGLRVDGPLELFLAPSLAALVFLFLTPHDTLLFYSPARARRRTAASAISVHNGRYLSSSPCLPIARKDGPAYNEPTACADNKKRRILCKVFYSSSSAAVLVPPAATFSTTHIGALFGTYFPFGTLFVNTLGSLLMGFIMGSLVFLMEKTGFTLAEPARLLLTVGFLGGFTTFSSFSLETVTLIEGGSLFYAAMNIAANLGLCFLATFLGLGAARALSAL